jgi:phospholipid/cholesterol/gamma-HCH transport system substrate-binding protein
MPQKKNYGLSDLRVGLLVLASIAILIMAVFAASGNFSLFGFSPFGGKTSVKTYMGNVDGLRRGGEVRLSGVRVGSIREINFNAQLPKSDTAPDQVEIVMDLNSRVNGISVLDRVRTDSRAVLKSAGVLGDYVVDITPGTANGQPIKDGAIIQSIQQKGVGDIINASQTAVANFNDISADIKDVTSRIRKGEGNIGKFLNDDAFYLNLNRSVLQIEEVVNALRKGEGSAGKFIKDPALYNQASEALTQIKQSIAQINDQINAGKGTVGKLLKDESLYNEAHRLVAKLNESSVRLDQMIAKIERGEGTFGKLLNDEKAYEDARAALASIKTISARLEAGEGTAGLLLKDQTLYNNLNQTSAEITKLLYDFRQNPRKYLSVKVSVF